MGRFLCRAFGSLGAPEWHGDSVNALVDSMIWGGINEISPPYRIVVRNIGHLPKDVVDEINLAKKALAEHRAYYCSQKGHDIIVEFEILK